MPKPASPVIAGIENRVVTIAKDSEVFLPLPALVKQEAGQATILCRWELDDLDRARIEAGADIFVELMLIENQLLNPFLVRVMSKESRDVAEGEGY